MQEVFSCVAKRQQVFDDALSESISIRAGLIEGIVSLYSALYVVMDSRAPLPFYGVQLTDVGQVDRPLSDLLLPSDTSWNHESVTMRKTVEGP